jgi:NAD(P)-dependent dehydrogenase (short-subunit alcohol dehydrogenase family)
VDLQGRTVLVLGGAGLVGLAVSRRVLEQRPRRLIVASLRKAEVEEARRALEAEVQEPGVEVAGSWGDLFLPVELKDRSRPEIEADPGARRLMVDDVYGELTEEVLRRSTLGALLLEERPDIIVDCVNTAGAMAYRNAFASAAELRRHAARGTVDEAVVEHHLATLYLPQLIRHVQVALEAMKRVETEIYVKIGTAGTGGMGLNIPFTHSEERPSRILLAKSGLAGAHTLLLYLMARTPGAPAVKEIKPTAAISWKSIAYGPVKRGGRTLVRSDATGPLPVEEAFRDGGGGYEMLNEPVEGVFLDSGENGLFSVSEFETLTALGLMEYVTPEEIADNVIREIRGQPSGSDVVSALDAATMGPTYRAGVLRRVALERMEELEAREGVRSVAYEMLGPPRLSKLLFEAHVLERLHGSMESAAELDPDGTARRARELLDGDADLRQRILSIGIPILLPDGTHILRGATVKVPLDEGSDPGIPGRVSDRGWVDLRPSNFRRWRDRCAQMLAEARSRPGPDRGSGGDHGFGEQAGTIRPGRLAAWIFRYEDEGERIKR